MAKTLGQHSLALKSHLCFHMFNTKDILCLLRLVEALDFSFPGPILPSFLLRLLSSVPVFCGSCVLLVFYIVIY